MRSSEDAKATLETKANRQKLLGDARKANDYSRCVFAPETAINMYPYPMNPGPDSQTTVPGLLNIQLNSKGSNCPFSVVICPSSDKCLGISVGDDPCGTTFTDQTRFLLDSNSVYGSYFDTTRQIPGASNYGTMRGDTAFEILLTPARNTIPGNDGDVFVVSDSNQADMRYSPEGYLDLYNPGTGTTAILSQLTVVIDTNLPAASQATQGQIRVAESADGITWTTLQQATVNSNAQESYLLSGFTSTKRYIAVFYRYNGVAANGNVRSVLSMSVSLTVTGYYAQYYTWYELPGVRSQYQAGIFKGEQAVARTGLLTCESSDLNNGGKNAGAQLTFAPGESPGAMPVVAYASVASRTNAYEGPLKKGLWGFWSPVQTPSFEYPGDPRDWTGESYLCLAGTFDSASASARIRANAITSFIVDSSLGQIFCPRPSVIRPAEAYFVLDVINGLRTHFCENPMHPKFQQVMERAASLWKAGKPYLGALGTAAKVIGPMLMAL